MRLKRSLWVVKALICISLLTILLPIGTAQQAELVIDVSVQLVETREPIGNRVVHVYNITAILHNSGDVKSDEITVYFYDPGYNKTTIPPMKLTPSNASLAPGESMTFVLLDWPTTLSGNIPINISFRPTSTSVLLKEGENFGYYVYMLSINNAKKTTSTPGFEIACVLIAILVLVTGRRIKK
jgi:hypothetical protein